MPIKALVLALCTRLASAQAQLGTVPQVSLGQVAATNPYDLMVTPNVHDVDAAGNVVFVSDESWTNYPGIVKAGQYKSFRFVRMDPTGKVLTDGRVLNPYNNSAEVDRVCTDSAGDIFMSGSYDVPTSPVGPTNNELFIWAYDHNGMQKWTKVIPAGSTTWNASWAMAADATGNLHFAYDLGQKTDWLTEIGPTGTALYTKPISGPFIATATFDKSCNFWETDAFLENGASNYLWAKYDAVTGEPVYRNRSFNTDSKVTVVPTIYPQDDGSFFLAMERNTTQVRTNSKTQIAFFDTAHTLKWVTPGEHGYVHGIFASSSTNVFAAFDSDTDLTGFVARINLGKVAWKYYGGTRGLYPSTHGVYTVSMTGGTVPQYTLIGLQFDEYEFAAEALPMTTIQDLDLHLRSAGLDRFLMFLQSSQSTWDGAGTDLFDNIEVVRLQHS
jgi:hypothetical protein